MYKVVEVKGKLALQDKYGTESIHVVHCAETVSELNEDVYSVYAVAEECTNYARVHLVTDLSEDEALQQVDEYLREQEGVEHTHLIGAFECQL
jgi:hypothetical protein